MARLNLDTLRMMTAGTYVTFCYVFIFLPVAVLVLFSFQDGTLPIPPFKGFSLQWYDRVFESRRVTDALWNSISVAILSSAVATALGFLAAYGLARYKLPGGGAMQWLLMAPISISYLVVGMGLLITYNEVGVPKSLLGLGMGHVAINLPIAFGILYSQMGAHQANIERAARDLGAAEWQVLLLVTVPMLWPALVAGFCLSFTLSWDEFIIAFLVTRFDVTLPVEIWSMLRTGLNPMTNAAATLVFFISILLVVIVELSLLRRRRRHG